MGDEIEMATQHAPQPGLQSTLDLAFSDLVGDGP